MKKVIYLLFVFALFSCEKSFDAQPQNDDLRLNQDVYEGQLMLKDSTINNGPGGDEDDDEIPVPEP